MFFQLGTMSHTILTKCVDNARLMMPPLINKELSWMSFNNRVLQEAANPDVPLIERIRFLGIYSSNRDEFFRVRVATLRRLTGLGKKARRLIGNDPQTVLDRIDELSQKQQEENGRIFKKLMRELKKEGINIVNERQLSKEQYAFALDYFMSHVRTDILPIMLDDVDHLPSLRDASPYLLIHIRSKHNNKSHHALVEIPSKNHPRFVRLPGKQGARQLIFLDDVIRIGLPRVFTTFKADSFEAYTMKITRDAEIDIDDDFSQSHIEKVMDGLKQRKSGDTVRFIYDNETPPKLLKIAADKLGIRKSDTRIGGGRYHNFKDLIRFPNFGRKRLLHPPLNPIPVTELEGDGHLLDTIRKGDQLLHLPYHPFTHVVNVLREAAIDSEVTEIQICLYRLAGKSAIINALINAAINGKKVTAVLELTARFDEEANIAWSEKLREFGVHVAYGLPGLKIHAKICLITRRRQRKILRTAIVGTGNYNEDTSRIYADHTLLTADKKITNDIKKLFDVIDSKLNITPFRHLIVSPFNTRQKILKLIDTETENHKKGLPAGIRMKLNNLVDEDVIRHLYAASEAGVPVKLIVRSMFSMPDIWSFNDNFEAISIVDRYLEHSRIYIFQNAGKPHVFISSADMMPRNLDRRIEVTCPVFDTALQDELVQYFDIQWADNTKARIWKNDLSNHYRKSSGRNSRAQLDIYAWLKNRRS